jgi:hypothetical protein
MNAAVFPYGDFQESSRGFGLRVELFDGGAGVSGFGVAWIASEPRVGIHQSAAGKLFDTRRVDRVILPVAVTAENMKALLI